jgi:peptidyl-prolyl cis-trans isomerase C
MRTNTRIMLSCLTIHLITIAIVGFAMAEQRSDKLVVAEVNGRAIYFSQLQPNIDEALAKYKKYGALSVSEETKKRLRNEELDRQIDFELVVQAAEKSLGSEVEKKVEDKIKEARANASKSEREQKSAEANQGNDEYRQQVRRKVLFDEYLTKRGIQELQVPEAELKKYYEQNRQSFKEPESRRVSHILIMLPKKPKPEEVAEARKQIVKIREEAVGGKSFADLAKQYSACATAKDGGDLGYISRGYMPQDFSKVAFALKDGEISDVVSTRHGFHLIKAFDKKPERIQELAEVKDFIEKFLLREVRMKKIKEITKELRRATKVVVYFN